MTTLTTYGLGGYDASKPNGNIIAVTDLPDGEKVPTGDDRLTAARGALAGLDSLGDNPSGGEIVQILQALKVALED